MSAGDLIYNTTRTMTENDISYIVRGSIIDVYKSIGPGLFESAYEAILGYELMEKGLDVRFQVPLPLIYVKLEAGYRLDLLINNKVIIEIKSVEALGEVHHKQILTYLKLSGKKLGILVNFNTNDILTSIFRKVNGL